MTNGVRVFKGLKTLRKSFRTTTFRSKKDPIRPKQGTAEFKALDDERTRIEKQAIGDTGTLPERLVRAFLERSGYTYYEQAAEFGGRLVIGGAVVDFIAFIGKPPGLVIRVQGDYWHSQAPTQAKDRVQRERLIAKGYRVLDVWEHDLYNAAKNNTLMSFMNRAIAEAA